MAPSLRQATQILLLHQIRHSSQALGIRLHVCLGAKAELQSNVQSYRKHRGFGLAPVTFCTAAVGGEVDPLEATDQLEAGLSWCGTPMFTVFDFA